eukprot:TRINITY_DN12287_c0_g1_i2.p1 TRINITY_DN12287_c0_g1~~TRINITY_DN12287_c0_g1_i2.p1  ORF type:complete len:173 (-),score=29.10 TRINITY_DN12287_c0_g1_i2:251-769(-)
MAAVVAVNAVQPDGTSCAHLSAEAGQDEVLQLLLDARASPKSKRERDGCTPLHLAASHGHVRAVQLLLDHNAEVNGVDSTLRSACHWAAYHNHGQVFQLLTRNEADILAEDAAGKIALDLVTNMGLFQTSCSALSDATHPHHHESEVLHRSQSQPKSSPQLSPSAPGSRHQV